MKGKIHPKYLYIDPNRGIYGNIGEYINIGEINRITLVGDPSRNTRVYFINRSIYVV